MIATHEIALSQRAEHPESVAVPVKYITTSDVHKKMEIARNRQELRDIISASMNIPLIHLVAGDAFAKAPRVWIIGGGPSLKGFDFNKLAGEVVIGTNRAYELDVVGINCSMDLRFKQWAMKGKLGNGDKEKSVSKDKWDNFRGVKVFTVIPEAAITEPTEEPVFVLTRPDVDHGQPDVPMSNISIHGLSSGNNSGQMALQFAIALGATEIHLLGFDMSGTPDGHQEWFHSGYPENQGSSVYNYMLKSFDPIAIHCRKNNIRVVNHSENSALTTFEIESLDTVDSYTSPKNHRPLVIGYYTKDSEYKKEIRGMEQTARFFGLDVHIYEMESLEDWHYNCLLKPTVIEQAMKDFPKRPLLFLDADARIRKYPELFDGWMTNFGYCQFDWANVPDATRQDTEVSSAVLFIRPTVATKDLIFRWKDACERCISNKEKVFDQQVLAKVLQSWKVPKECVVERIPMSYNQIFDTMAGLGEPVIEQMQASRRLKGTV
jgi:hypothetical protein